MKEKDKNKKIRKNLKKEKYHLEDVWEMGRKIPPPPDDLPEPKLSENACYIARTRYALRDEKSEPIESPKEMFWRVAYNISLADLLYGASWEGVLKQAKIFYYLMSSQKFLPNTPTLLNAGKPKQQLSACFVLPIEDSMESIGKTMVDMILIHKSGGGTGFSFSRLRPYGDIIHSSKGTTVGPVSFLQAYNDVTSQIKQGGVRRGANMGILHITHPDILRFIVMKVDEFNLTNFNISVAVTEEWMRKVEEDKKFVDSEPNWDGIIEEIKKAQQIRDVDLKLKKTEEGVAKLYEIAQAQEEDEGYELINPRTNQVVGKLNAYKVFLLITKLAWLYGDPGMIFIDRINNSFANPTPFLGEIEATNPCGEQPLLPYDSCTLGSINVGKFVSGKKIDWESLGEVVKEAVHFLDNVLDMNHYPLSEIREMTGKIRRIGLGIMGFADFLVELEIGYNTEEGLKIAEDLMSFIKKEARKASINLAKKRGVFPAWKGSIYDPKSPYFCGEELRLRNGALTTIAPTGTISLLADCNSGIEPFFAISYVKNTIEGKKLFVTNPFFLKVAQEEGFYSENLLEKIDKNNGSVRNIPEIPEKWQKVFVTAREISPEWHIKMQAAFQKHVDNAISKTINFPNEATVEDVRQAYFLVYSLGCKGITIYRDGSRVKQVLEVKKEKSYFDQLQKDLVSSQNLPGQNGELSPLNGEKNPEYKNFFQGAIKAPEEAWGMRLKKKSDVGNVYTAVFRNKEGRPIEVFVTVGKSGGYVAGAAEVTGRLASLALKHGASLGEVASELIGISCGTPYGFGPNAVLSMFDAVGKSLFEISQNRQLSLIEENQPVLPPSDKKEDHFLYKEKESSLFASCPDCGAKLVMIEGCVKCLNPLCGYSRC